MTKFRLLRSSTDMVAVERFLFFLTSAFSTAPLPVFALNDFYEQRGRHCHRTSFVNSMMFTEYKRLSSNILIHTSGLSR